MSNDIKIKVGAARDASLGDVFRPLTEAAKRARTQAANESKAAGQQVAAGYKAGTSKAEAAFKHLADEVSGKTSSMLTPAAKAAVDFGKTAKTSFDATRSSFADMARAMDREMAKLEQKMARPPAAGGWGRALMGVGGTTLRGAGAAAQGINRGFGTVAAGASTALSMATRVAGGFARGAGIDTDLSSHIQKNVQFEKTAQDIVNSGFMPGQAGAAGVRQDRGALMKDLQATASDTGMDFNKAAEGLQAFVGKTGDLETGRAIMKDMAILSRATGTELNDMVDAAGDVSANLGDVPNKGEKINQIMKAIAGQGKLGAVEVRDLATQMAKLAANAGQFEGDVGQNIALLGAFAQEARQKGGASSANMAASSVAAMVNTFKTSARVKAFKSQGIDVYNSQGQIRNPEQIVIQALQKKGLDPVGFKAMFANVAGARAVEGFATTYRQAHAASTGKTEQDKVADATAAVREEFERLKKAAMLDGEVMDAFRASMNTTEAQSTVLNNKLSEAAGQLQQAFTPALIALTPVLTQMASDFASLAVSLANKLTGQDYNEGLKKSGDLEVKGVRATRLAGEALRSGEITPENAELLDKARADLKADVEKREKEVADLRKDPYATTGKDAGKPSLAPARALWDWATGETENRKRRASEAGQQLEASKEALNDADTLARAISTRIMDGELKVRVVNQPPPPPPGAPGDGRTPPPSPAPPR